MIKVRVTRKSIGRREGGAKCVYPAGSVLEVSERVFEAFGDRLERVEGDKPVSKPVFKAQAKFKPMKAVTLDPVEPESEPESEVVINETPPPVAPVEAEDGHQSDDPPLIDVPVRRALEVISETQEADLLRKWSADSRATVRNAIARRLRALGADDE